MTHVEVWLMALALAMDCFAVAIASGIFFKKVFWKPMLTMAFLFGFFQALNPLLGWWGTDMCRALIESVDHWLAFAILGFMGVRMIIESIQPTPLQGYIHSCNCHKHRRTGGWHLVLVHGI